MPKQADYAIVVMPEHAGGYAAVCPSFKNCVGRGETRADALDAAVFELDRIIEQHGSQAMDLPSPRPVDEPSPVLNELSGRLNRMQARLNEAECMLGFSRLSTKDKFRTLREHRVDLIVDRKAN